MEKASGFGPPCSVTGGVLSCMSPLPHQIPPSETLTLAGAEVQGGEAERAAHCGIWQPLTFPRGSPPAPPGSPPNHRQEGKRGPECLPLPRAPRSHRTRTATAPSKYAACLLQSHFPRGGRRKLPAMTWTEEHLSLGTFQEGLAGHCAEEGEQLSGDNGLRSTLACTCGSGTHPSVERKGDLQGVSWGRQDSNCRDGPWVRLIQPGPNA